MNITQLEKEIIKALKINSNVDWLTVDPNQEFKDLIKFVKKLFKEHNNGY
jgi:hypothetical protein